MTAAATMGQSSVSGLQASASLVSPHDWKQLQTRSLEPSLSASSGQSAAAPTGPGGSSQTNKEKTLITSSKSLKALLATALAGASLMAFGAASASASEWVTPSGWFEGEGSLTLELNGKEPVQCPQVRVEGSNVAGFWLTNWFSPMFYGECDTGYVSLATALSGEDRGAEGLFASASDELSQNTPYGTYVGSHWEAQFQNAAAGQPSTLTFDHTQIGAIGGNPITASGSFELSDGQGGDVTLQG